MFTASKRYLHFNFLLLRLNPKRRYCWINQFPTLISLPMIVLAVSSIISPVFLIFDEVLVSFSCMQTAGTTLLFQPFRKLFQLQVNQLVAAN